MPPGSLLASFASSSATPRLSLSSSRTHGPAIRKSASSRKIGTSVARFRKGGRRFAATALRLDRRGDEAGEQRMRARRARLELRMELAADEPWMLGILDDLDELPVGTETGQAQPVLHEHVAVLVRHLV